MARRNPSGTFGLVPTRGRGGSRGFFRGSRGRGRGRGRGGHTGSASGPPPERADEGTLLQERFEEVRIKDEIDEKLGFARYQEGPKKVGWLVNMHPTLMTDPDHPAGRAGVDYYFIEDDGGMFKATILYEPYFYIGCKLGMESIVEEWLMKKYEGLIVRISRERKEDLKQPNHLLGHRRTYLQIIFRSMSELLAVRRELVPLAQANAAKLDAVDAYAEVVASVQVEMDGADVFEESLGAKGKKDDPAEMVIDIREYDVPYYLRVAIDNDIRVGLWYTVTASQGSITLAFVPERVKRAEPVVMAYDIETTKAPLKFPDSAVDQIMMISYMIDGQGFLITNREIVSEDIEDFEYTPKDEYEGPFRIFNEPNEAAVIRKWFSHIREAKPTVMATYNGDSFDFPFVEARATANGISMFNEIGFARDQENEFKCNNCVHMDCFRWVKRDSYLPQGSQGLKAVTVAKLGYDPIELDPELMTPYALEQPQVLAQYSVSDAVATYYLYMKYVHPFVFSLCNIIPLNPDEVLRKGTGTLCETLLMVEAYRAGVIMPNRHVDPHGNMYEGHLLSSETYVGGHVEALEAGVFRSDIPTDFKIVPSAVQQLIDDLDNALKFSITVEEKKKMDDVLNYDEVKGEIQRMLEELRDNPVRHDTPLIYHLDVAAMYPNIMLSNRLQPDSVVDEAMCATCDYNRPGKTCDRRMTWAWRGEFFPAKRDEYNMVRHALEQEWFPGRYPSAPKRRFVDLSPTEQTTLLHKRLGDYSRKVYKKTHETRIVERETIICQRENPFYIDTVRAFRDRRYEYKGLHKTWKKNLDTAAASGSLSAIVEAKKMIVLYDSLQLAHKCILNSFYGYVMRKGARWYSMEMAGITCLTGATIIQMARQLVEQIGRPLELDTDGIWCMLPGTFPENFSFKLAGGKKLGISYPCTMLNHLVHDRFTNDQYHDLVDKDQGVYAIHSENSIFFELDGPYKAMILPSSKEEDKLLKKRYAVFNDDGSLAELKGFEVKRRGELQLIKIFQSQIFEKFLLGSTTEECYAAVAEVADEWLDILFNKAANLHDDELVELISENRSMSKTLAEYEGQKSTSISTARRLAEFLGEQMVKDKGLSCRFIISSKPQGAPVTERAVPVAIFTAEPSIKQHFLRKWLKDNSLVDFELRSILDWDYYIERLGSVIQKLITIPAALQKVANPVHRIRHPDWLHKRVATREDKFKQHKLTDMFARQREKGPVRADLGIGTSAAVAGAVGESADVPDLEDFGAGASSGTGRALAQVKKAAVRAKGKEKAPSPPEQRLPDPTVDYPGWVKQMRKRWRTRRKEKAERRHLFGASAATTASKASVAGMFQTRSLGLSSHAWDVVQVSPTSRPGEFKLWLSIGPTLQSLKLRVPRQFYLNLKQAPQDGVFADGYLVESLVRTLPRGHPCLNLFRITVAEEDFVAGESHFKNLVNNPNVDAVYEMQIPLVVRALLALGSTCTMEAGATGGLSRGLDNGFDLHDLVRAPPSVVRHRYLESASAMRYAYIFHSHSDSRHMLGLFLPGGGAKVFVVDTSRVRPRLPNLERAYAEQLARSRERQMDPSAGAFAYPDELSFETSYHTSESAALKALSRALAASGGQRRGATMLAICSPRTQTYFERQADAVGEYPIITVPVPRKEPSIDALMWTAKMPLRMLRSYLRLSVHVKETIDLAAHYDVPFCNIERDAALFFADLDFARRLQKHDMILWWSPSTKPDLGGREEDVPPQQIADDIGSLEFSNSGAFSNVVLEVELRDLAVNAVLQSALVNEMEGSGAASTAFDSTAHTLDDYSKGQARASVTLGEAVVSTQTFAVLKAMVKAWYLDKARSVNARGNGGLLADHFWRWISSSTAQMFDPALHRFLQGLMRKTFLQLLAEIKRLGSGVVYADFGRLFILTSKPTAGSALAYANYILSAVTSHELFKHVSLSIVHFWDYLVWMDAGNYGGVINHDPEAVEPSDEVNVDMQWAIRHFLPPALQPPFGHAIAEFIYQSYEHKRRSFLAMRTPLRVLQNSTQGPGPDPVKSAELDFGRKLISNTLTRRLLKDVSGLIRRQSEAAMRPEDMAAFTFPLLPGSHLDLHNPTLEFIKFTCAVLALAKDYMVETQILKRNLLDLIKVREFADEAIFRNPCMPFKVPMVICPSCASVRTLDLTRDAELQPHPSDDPTQPPQPRPWLCRCGQEYDKGAIELALLSTVDRHVGAYQTQDRHCGKCGAIADDDLSSHHICSGPYNLVTPKAELRRQLTTVSNVARFHGLSLLHDYTKTHLTRL